MAILGLMTSGSDGRIGLQMADGAILVSESLGRTSRGRDLCPAVLALLTDATLTPKDLTGIVADLGPGSFTGVRVAVTCAKSLAFALQIPVVGVLSLDLIAQAAPLDDPIVAVRDAGRNTLYVAKYGARVDGRPLREAAARVQAADAFANEDAVFYGEDALALATKYEAQDRAHDVHPTVAGLLVLGARALALETGALGEALSPHALAPVYLQASAPERLQAGEV